LPTSTDRNIIIDGYLTDWGNLSCGIPMYEAGKPSMARVSTAFVNWDCSNSNSKLCILVKADTGYYLDSNTQAWFKIYDDGHPSEETALYDGVKLIHDPSSNVVIGWEGCYSVVPDCLEQVEIHANFHDSTSTIDQKRTASTGNKNSNARIALDLTICPITTTCNVSLCPQGGKCQEAICTNNLCGLQFKPAGVVCRAIAVDGDCDVPEYCTGNAADCPEDVFKPATVECRRSWGPCDKPEYCTGSSAPCPADVF
jgi:hypothetical protein